MLTSPIRTGNNKIKEGQNPICTFYFHPSHRHTDAATCMRVSPDIYIFSPYLNSEILPYQTLPSFLVILVTTPYQTQNAPLITVTLATLCTPCSTLVCKASPLKD